MRNTVVLLSLLFTLSVHASAVDEARNAEIAFAKAFADRDAAKFFSFILDDATFMGAKHTLTGKAEVVKAWTALFKDSNPPFSWQPERVVANAAGDLALSTGPVIDAKGNHMSDYSSIWQKQKDGSWKILFDGPGSHVCPPAGK